MRTCVNTFKGHTHVATQLAQPSRSTRGKYELTEQQWGDTPPAADGHRLLMGIKTGFCLHALKSKPKNDLHQQTSAPGVGDGNTTKELEDRQTVCRDDVMCG